MKLNSPLRLTLETVVAARSGFHGAIALTPCSESIPLSELTDSRIFCKREYLQRTGSFKERGARHALSLMTPAEAQRGAIAASAGNHALGLSWHGRALGILVTVVMPRFAPLIKVATCRRLGATVLLQGDTFEEARTGAEPRLHSSV